MQDPSAASIQPAQGRQGPTTGTAESFYTLPQAGSTLAAPAVPPAQVNPPEKEKAQQEHEAGMAAHPGQGLSSSQNPVAPKNKAGKHNPLSRALQAISSGCGRCCGRMHVHGESP